MVNTNATAEQVADILRETEAYYVIGFERDPTSKLDARRNVEIKVARRNVRAYTQRQFIAPRASPAADATSPSSDAALTGLLPAARRPLALDLAAFASPDGIGATVHVTVDVAGFARERSQASVEIRTAVFDQAAKEIGSARQTSTLPGIQSSGHRPAVIDVPTHIDLPTGDYEVRVAVSEPGTSLTSSVFGQILVPQFASERLSLSDVALELADADASGPGRESPITPTTQRTFVRGDRVRAFLQIYQGTRRTNPIAPVTMRVRILDWSGAVASDQSIILASTDFRDRRTDSGVNLPLDRLGPGEYLLEISATTDTETSARKLRFSLR